MLSLFFCFTGRICRVRNMMSLWECVRICESSAMRTSNEWSFHFARMGNMREFGKWASSLLACCHNIMSHHLLSSSLLCSHHFGQWSNSDLICWTIDWCNKQQMEHNIHPCLLYLCMQYVLPISPKCNIKIFLQKRKPFHHNVGALTHWIVMSPTLAFAAAKVTAQINFQLLWLWLW